MDCAAGPAMTGRLAVIALLLAVSALPAASAVNPKPFGLRPLHAALAPEQTVPADRDGNSRADSLGEIWRVQTDRKEIALTFDDGPYPFYTPLLLHELERSHAVATFFLVGRSSQEFPELVQQIVADGDEVGNHTFNHYKLTKLTTSEIAQQISADGEFLEPFVGHPITLFRPPYGRYDHRVVALAHAMGYETVFWNNSPEDTKNISPSLLVSRVIAHATPGGIVLLHNGQYKTVEALPVIIDSLRARGYTFVTVGQLLKDGDPDAPAQRL
jgi:peptidoglycan/xylan/chitin deacetylase (PgdA/CDA1 family)